MTNDRKRTLLRVVLFATAGFLMLGLPFMFDLWPAGFRWAHPSEHRAYERMIIAIHFALGVCLVPTALGTKPGVTLRSYPGLNHLLIAGEGKSLPVEYTRAGHVAEEIVRDIAAWIASTIK